MWTLELRLARDGSWTEWTRGTLDECMADLWAWKAGNYGTLYDAARLGTERASE